MTLITIFTEPAILIITAFFLFFILTVLKNYTKTEKNLKSVYEFLNSLDKKEISYRYNQLNSFMLENSYTNTAWEDFKKALIFPEKLYSSSQTPSVQGSFSPEIYLTMDASFFFNEDTLIHSKINNKFIQAMPTLLTGLGPFFTFLKMALAFAKIDLSVSAAISSLNELISNIQIAALCSVFAVGYSLLFLFFENNKLLSILTWEFIVLDLCVIYYLSLKYHFLTKTFSNHLDVNYALSYPNNFCIHTPIYSFFWCFKDSIFFLVGT